MRQPINTSTIGGVVNPLFSTPLYTNLLNRSFHEHEHQCFGDVLQRMRHNTGNLASMDCYVLNDERLSDLKTWLQSCVDDYFNIVFCPSKNIEPYITISWINCTENGRYHHKHNHPNSIISGVFYIDVDESSDSIVFHKDEYGHIRFYPHQDNYNLYNAESWTLSTQTGVLMLFPSSLTHSVSSTKSISMRISLSFNVFVKGILGDEDTKTFLELK